MINHHPVYKAISCRRSEVRISIETLKRHGLYFNNWTTSVVRDLVHLLCNQPRVTGSSNQMHFDDGARARKIGRWLGQGDGGFKLNYGRLRGLVVGYVINIFYFYPLKLYQFGNFVKTFNSL